MKSNEDIKKQASLLPLPYNNAGSSWKLNSNNNKHNNEQDPFNYETTDPLYQLIPITRLVKNGVELIADNRKLFTSIEQLEERLNTARKQVMEKKKQQQNENNSSSSESDTSDSSDDDDDDSEEEDDDDDGGEDSDNKENESEDEDNMVEEEDDLIADLQEGDDDEIKTTSYKSSQ
eukprot:UN04036